MNPTDLLALHRRCEQPPAHPDPPAMCRLAEQVVDWVVRHHAALPELPVGDWTGRTEMEARLRETAPEQGRDFAEVLARFDRDVAGFACHVQHPRFLAFIPGAPSFPAILGDWLCSGSNFFAGVWLEAAGPAQVELVVLDWFRDFLGLPAGTAGILTGGGSEANLTALVVARERLAAEDRARAVLYTGEQRHWSVDRAAHVIGLSPGQVRRIASDEHGRLSLPALLVQVQRDRRTGCVPWAVVASAGTTGTGTIDPLAELADACREQRLWLHVDAAYGWAAALVAEGKRLLIGIERADSVTLDPHKWLAQPFEVGGLLVRQGELLAEAFAIRPEYMQDVEPGDDEINFADHGIALTRRFRALKVWLSIQALGVEWFRQLIRHCLALKEYARALLEQAGFEIVCPGPLSIVCFRPILAVGAPEEVDRRVRYLIDAVRRSREAFLSSTRLQGRDVLRMCFINWRTTPDDVERVVRLLATSSPPG